ncbi:MAG: NAD(P)-dependent alcohol dehydrogenase [Microbacteriaceae bacterium]|nr:NAD(P)-dependent alcohol dehydrogenase [Microbacteriaceae bacterium]
MEEITNGTGVDYVVDTPGRPEVLRLAADSLGVGVIPQLIQLWHDGRFPFEMMIADYTPDEITRGFDDSTSGKTSKPVIIF